MRRMVIEYTDRYYLPAAAQGELYQANGWSLSKEMIAWRAAIRSRWQHVRVELGTLPKGTVTVGDPIQIQAKVWLDNIAPADVAVELVTGFAGSDGDVRKPISLPMIQTSQEGDALLYSAAFTPERSGPLAVGVRICPQRPNQIYPIDPYVLIRWA